MRKSAKSRDQAVRILDKNAFRLLSTTLSPSHSETTKNDAVSMLDLPDGARHRQTAENGATGLQAVLL